MPVVDLLATLGRDNPLIPRLKGDQPLDQQLAIANGQIIMMAMLVTELDRQGFIGKEAFSKLLAGSADAALAHDPGMAPNRMDIVMLRKVAELLVQPQGWTPTVVEGGLDTP